MWQFGACWSFYTTKLFSILMICFLLLAFFFLPAPWLLHYAHQPVASSDSQCTLPPIFYEFSWQGLCNFIGSVRGPLLMQSQFKDFNIKEGTGLKYDNLSKFRFQSSNSAVENCVGFGYNPIRTGCWAIILRLRIQFSNLWLFPPASHPCQLNDSSDLVISDLCKA